jgi:hypothetical protein
MQSTSLRINTVILALATFGLVASGFAQSTCGPDGGWAHRGGGRGAGPIGSRGERRLPSPEQVEGPANPAVMQDLVGLTPDQLQKYTARYNDHIAATKSVRDSLRTTMQTMRAEFEDGDRDSAREHGPIAERLWKDLAPKDQAFSKGLEDLLSKEQLREYQKREKEQTPPQHWGRPPGPPPGDDDSGPGDRCQRAQFTTIYPGWYSGRAVHIHFKVRSAAGASSSYEFTSQLFFDDTLTDQVHGQPPYASKGTRDTRNANDGIYQQGGSQLVLNVTQTSQGYAATFDIALENV